jgi:[acyl-carrier-protein] S-malonyltransferase
LMDEAARKEAGKMVSILGLDAEKIEEICKGVGGCQVANLNCPGQVVISGYASRVELVSDLAVNAGAKRAIALKVSGAFHSELMRPAKEKLKAVLDGIEIKEPVIDLISNLDAEVTRDPVKIRTNLINQLDHKTLWEASVRKAISLGVKDYLEVGPGTVLKGLAKKIDPSINVMTVHSAQDMEGLFASQQ